MVVNRSNSADKKPLAKGTPGRTASKNNVLKQTLEQKKPGPPRPPTRSNSSIDNSPPPTTEPMEVDHSSDPSSALPSSTNPASGPPSPSSTAPATAPNASSTLDATSSPTRSIAAATAEQPPQSPPQQSRVQDLTHQATLPHHNKSKATRKNKIYFSLQFPPATIPTDKKVTSTIKLAAYRQNLIKIIETLVKIDDSIALWPYEYPNSPESDLLNNPTALGESINQIQNIFDGFRIHKELSRCYVNCLLGFDMDYDRFMESATVMLEDVPAQLYKRTLQVPHIAPLGWLFGTHKEMSLQSFEGLLNTVVSALAPNQAPAIQLGLSFKPIWDGTSKKECEQTRAKDRSRTKWAIHVEAIAEIALTSKAFLKKALLSSEIRAHTNLPLLLVPILQKKTPVSEAEEIKRAIARHATVLQSISKSFSSKILSLNRPLPSLQNATLRTTLMAVTTSAGKKLFLSADPTWNGQGFSISYPTLYAAQASDFVEYLPAYLAHSHGEDVYRWFTADAIAEAKAMDWDQDKQRPISQDGLALCSTLQSLDLEWCLASPDANKPSTTAKDLDSITIPSFNTANLPAAVQPGIPSVAPPAAALGSSQHAIEVHDDITMASTVDSRLSALEESCALLPLIMKKLEALSPPPPSTAPRSTSTPAVSSTPSVHGSASGARD